MALYTTHTQLRVWLLQCMDEKCFYFPSGEFFKRKMFNSVVAVFSFFWNCPWRALSVSAESLVYCVKHVSGDTAVGNPEVVGYNPTVDHICSILYILANTFQIFKSRNKVFFRRNWGIFWQRGFSAKKSPICDITATNRFFSEFNSKIWEKFFDSFKKPKKN